MSGMEKVRGLAGLLMALMVPALIYALHLAVEQKAGPLAYAAIASCIPMVGALACSFLDVPVPSVLRDFIFAMRDTIKSFARSESSGPRRRATPPEKP